MTATSDARWRPALSHRGPIPALAARLDAVPLPRAPSPMLCTLVAEPFNNKDWIFEPKYDGLRVIGVFDGQRLTLLSRNHQPQNLQFPDIVAALQASLRYPAIVDGEVVCFDAQGRTSFRSLQQRFHLKDAAEVQERMQQYPAYLYLFDLLYVDRFDVSRLPLDKRKELLREAVDWSEHIRWTPFQEGEGMRLWRQACREESEGIVGKLRSSRYVHGRSDAWVKIKCLARQEFVIGGFTDPQRTRVGLGALLAGYYSDDGKRLLYAGKVGTGYTHEMLLDLRQRLDPLEQAASPFHRADVPHDEHVHWVKPQLVAEIAFGEWTQNGMLRQPRFEGLRPDKRPKECRRERPQQAVPQPAPGARNHRPPPPGDPTLALQEYEAKRDFRKTPEPAANASAAHRQPIFVVQEHHASRLHYDFRLEADGVLKSWAVPKQPVMDPAEKRLAVRVEDHPLAYATFHGEIPEGEYGAGTVEIWDHGTYELRAGTAAAPRTVAEGLDAGRLEFTLHGEKLQGAFVLIRMKTASRKGKENWLLIKMKDEHVRRAADAAEATPPKKTARRPRKNPRAAVAEAAPPSAGAVAFTHTDKVLFPDAGITKADVLAFYERIAPRLLPYLRDRPVTLERLPEGLGDKDRPHFWQKDTPAYYPDWIPRVELPTERGKTVHYVLVNDRQTLLYLVNQGTLTFHPWLSRIQDLDRPDFVLFDLDPGEAAFAEVAAVARQLHDLLTGERRKAYVKTSGKTGLHVLVPWTAEGGYDDARTWAQGMAQRVVEALPEQATVEMRKARRGGRVYVDTLQNARGHHAVPPYVLRAVPAATVSTPLQWNEVTADLDPARYTLTTIFRRLARQKQDPLASLARMLRAQRVARV
jgi:bifunctional non-homologous end joining protein LigD